MQKSYNQAVEDPEKLNEYKSWSPEVYGETSFDFIAQLLDTVTLSQDDVFIDLGSGVGQVVLQVAASVDVKMCIGIEKADVPFRYSQQLDRHFRFWMEWFGKVSSGSSCRTAVLTLILCHMRQTFSPYALEKVR